MRNTVVAVALVAAVLCTPAAAANINMTLHLFTNATQRHAMCNDGTPSGYYLWKPPVPSNDWIIYLEGGGLCTDFKSCSKRPPLLKSSTPWPATLAGEGLLNNDTDNKFAGFNKIVVIYCTSDLYSGTLTTPDPLLNFTFSGAGVVPALLEDLEHDPHWTSSGQLLFTGGSAGGVGVWSNYPYVKAKAPQAVVKALPDAGWFLTTMPPYSKSAEPLGTMFRDGMKLWHGEPLQECAIAVGSGDAHLCYSGPVAYPFMPKPLDDVMVLKAQTDEWTVGHDGVKAPYTADELVWMAELAAQVQVTLKEVTNAFSADCVYHTSLQLLWDTVKVNGTVLHDAVTEWFFDGTTTKLVDTCDTPLCNTSCL